MNVDSHLGNFPRAASNASCCSFDHVDDLISAARLAWTSRTRVAPPAIISSSCWHTGRGGGRRGEREKQRERERERDVCMSVSVSVSKR